MFSLDSEYELSFNTFYDCVKSSPFISGAPWIKHDYNFLTLHFSIAGESFSLLYFSK